MLESVGLLLRINPEKKIKNTYILSPPSKFAFYFNDSPVKKPASPLHLSFIFLPNIVKVPNHELFFPFSSAIFYWRQYLPTSESDFSVYSMNCEDTAQAAHLEKQLVGMHNIHLVWKFLCWVEKTDPWSRHTLPRKINLFLLLEHTAILPFPRCLSFLPQEMATWKEGYAPRSHQKMPFSQGSVMGIRPTRHTTK